MPTSVGHTERAPAIDSADEGLAARFSQAALQFSRKRAANLTMLVGFGSVELLTQVRDGRVVEVADKMARPPLQPFDFSIRAGAEAWQRFWQRIPPAGSHDIFALMRAGEMTIEGNLLPLMSNLQFVKDLLSSGGEGRK